MVNSILPLHIADAQIYIKGKRIIGPINFRLLGSGITTIIGPTGSGKTTLLRLMHGLEMPVTGSLSWSATRKGNPQRHTSFVFQKPTALNRTTRENIAYPLQVRGIPKAKAMKQADQWLERVGLAKQAGQNANQLSGGEIQKMAIARALINDPQVLFLDEPTTNLDAISTRDIETLIKKSVMHGTRIVMTTHDMGQIRRLSDEIIFLYQGRVLEYKPAEIFLQKTETSQARAYLSGDIVL